MPVTRAPTACNARANSRWFAGKQGSRKTTSGVIAQEPSTAMVPRMKVLFVSSEVAPFAKTGGLGDVSAALPRHLKALGHEVLVFLPMYAKVHAPGRSFVEVVPALDFALGPHQIRVSIFAATLPGSRVQVCFVRCPPLYDRPGIYGNGPDEHLRFAVLCHAALHACPALRFAPD